MCLTGSIYGSVIWNNATEHTGSHRKCSIHFVSPFTGKTYTHSDVFHGKNVYHGIDVSYHNGAIDWAKAAADGVEYAFIRVGYRGWGSGTVVEDPRFKTYIKDALDAGVHVGLYFFTEARTTKEAIEEANFCLKMAANYDIELPIAFDYEYQYSDGSLVQSKGRDQLKHRQRQTVKLSGDTISGRRIHTDDLCQFE